MNDSCCAPGEVERPAMARWSLGGLFLEALAGRDFAGLADCFEPTAVMRALLPDGPTEFVGVSEIVAAFEHWFGGAQEFEVLGGTVGEVGQRLSVAWRLRAHPTPRGDDRWHVIEQQAYVRTTDRIDAIDLLSTEFLREQG
jgi:hypothetical protein